MEPVARLPQSQPGLQKLLHVPRQGEVRTRPEHRCPLKGRDLLRSAEMERAEKGIHLFVKHDAGGELRRGVVFVKEIVPRAAIATVARLLYGEPYERWEMSNFRNEEHVRYSWSRGECTNNLSVTRGNSLGVPEPGSHGASIIAH